MAHYRKSCFVLTRYLHLENERKLLDLLITIHNLSSRDVSRDMLAITTFSYWTESCLHQTGNYTCYIRQENMTAKNVLNVKDTVQAKDTKQTNFDCGNYIPI